VEKPDARVFLGDGIEFDELVIVDLDEGLVGDAVFLKVEGLLEAELFVKGGGGGEIVDADGDVSDAVERGWRGAVRLGVSEGGEEGGSCGRAGPAVGSFAVPLNTDGQFRSVNLDG
jgi:hypothetical protein